MALKEAGINLIAKGYQSYMQALANINKAQKAAFDDRSVKQFNASVQQTTQTSKAWANVVSRASVDSKKLSGSVSGLTQGMSRFGSVAATAGGASGMGGVVSSLAAVAGPAALAAAGIGLVVFGLKKIVDITKKVVTAFTSFMKVSGDAAARNETLAVVLLQVGKSAGYTEDQILAAEAALRGTGITIEQSRSALTSLAQANVEWSEATKLGRLAQNAAVRANIDSSEAFGRLIYGMQTNNRLILRRLGLVVDWEKAQKALAKELGVNVGQLTEYDIAQARVNAVLEAGTRIAGSYEAAMKTVGKQQGSMIRLVKDAQAEWGKLMLPIMETSVELRSTFWTAMRTAGEGLSFFADALDKGRDALSDYASKIAGAAESWLQAEGYLRKGQTIVDGIAERLFEASKNVVKFGVVFMAAGKTAWQVGEAIVGTLKWVGQSLLDTALSIEPLVRGIEIVGAKLLKVAEIAGVTGAAIASAMGEGVPFAELAEKNLAGIRAVGEGLAGLYFQNFAEIEAAAKETFPWLSQTYAEAMASIEADMDRGTDAINRQLRALQMQKTALEASLQVTAAMESVILKYEKAIASAYEKRAAALAAMSEDAAEKEIKISEDLADKLAQIEERAAERRTKLRSQYARNREKLELNYQKKLQQNYEKYLLRRQQSQRRFALSERRLAAAGDVLGLIMAREDEALRLKEEEENRELGLRHDAENYQARLAEMEAAFNEQMVLLAQETEKQRKAAIDAATQQRLDMQRGLLDQRQLIEDNYAKQLQMAEQAKNDSLIQLGRKFQAEGKITDEGLKDVIALINESYGADGFADALYTGFAQRAEETMTALYDSQRQQLEEIISMMAYISEFREMPSERPPVGPWTVGGTPRIPRRMGGEDIVTGPATFVVEPGVTEYHSFVPLPVSQAINVRHSGRFELGGAQNASSGMVDLALERMVDSFDLALRKLRRR